MIDRLIPKYPTFLVVGFLVLVSALFLLTPARDAMIAVWANNFFDGQTDGTLFKTTKTADAALDHFVSTWLFVGLSLVKLGIGFAIATIVRNLRATGHAVADAYGPLGVGDVAAARVREPWYGRWFTRFLVLGVATVLLALAMTLWWDANTVLLKKSEFDGHTTGAAYHTWVIIDQTLDPVITGVKFAGEGLLVLGIASGLATIVSNLSFQSRGLAFFTRKAMGQDPGPMADTPASFRPWGYLSVAIAGAILLALSLPAGMVQAGFASWAKWKEFDGGVSGLAMNTSGILDRSIEPAIVMGLGLLFFAIAFLLLAIIRYLREQRQAFGHAVADLSGGVIARPAIEPTLWPTKVVAPLAVFGLFVVTFFFLGMAGVRSYNFDQLTLMRLDGVTDTVRFQNALRLDAMLNEVVAAGRFVGIGVLMLAIGLALVTIVINLRATGILLPTGFSKLIPAARGEKVEDEDLTVTQPMSLAPWDLLRPHLLGEAFIFTATFPIVILFAVSIHRMLGQQFAGLGGPEAVSGLFKSSFLAVNLYAASLAPWMLFGMGLILFAIGRFFTTIVGFVEARHMVIKEGVESIAEAAAARTPAFAGAARNEAAGGVVSSET